MDNQILQDLQLFGLDQSVTTKELQTRWRQLSSHTHPDRFKKGTPEFDTALAKQKRLNCAKDRLTAYIALRDAEGKTNAASEPAQPSHQHERQDTAEEYSAINIPHIRTTESEVNDSEITLNVSRTLVDELSSVGMFLGALFIGVAVACFVSAAFPFLASTAPIILITVMLVTMFGALFKMQKWCLSKAPELSHDGNGAVHNVK